MSDQEVVGDCKKPTAAIDNSNQTNFTKSLETRLKCHLKLTPRKS